MQHSRLIEALRRRSSALQAVAGIVGIALVGVGTSATAQEGFPEDTIQVITHAGAGGGTDINARMLIRGLEETQGWDLQIVNRQGGAGALALQYLSGREADGHTISMVTPTHFFTMARGNAPLEFEDLTPLVRSTADPQVIMVRIDSELETVDDIIEASQDGPLDWGTTHVGSVDHIAIHQFAKAAGVEYEVVPFAGGGEVVTNLVGGDVDAALVNVSEGVSLLDAGELKPVAVMAEERMSTLPDTPTTVEEGIDVQAATVRGVVTLADVPQEQRERLEAALLEATKTDRYQEYLTNNGMTNEAVADGETFARQLRRLYEDGEEVLTELGMLDD